MLFFTFDTALDKTYITLCNNEDILHSEVIESNDDHYHSAYLISTIVEILKKYNLKMTDINAIGVNIGPGSFTGVRACVTIARVIAQQLNLPLIGVSSLEIISKINKTGGQTTVILDARKDMCYFAKYAPDGTEMIKPGLVDVDTLEITEKDCVITDASIKEKLSNKNILATCYTDLNEDLGYHLAKIVFDRINKNLTNNWATVKPLYIQVPSISKPKKSALGDL